MNERGQSLTAFLATKKASFAELRRQGLDLLGSTVGRHLLGRLILKQGAFSMDQKQRLKVVTNGSIDYKELEMAIQKIFGDKLDDSHPADSRRWRTSSYWAEDENGYPTDECDEADEIYAAGDYEAEYDKGIFDDLVCLNDADEVQLVFHQAVIMEENEVLKVVGQQIEEVFYESRDCVKGKGKGKKGKGKGQSSTKTFDTMGKPAFCGGCGGYLEHRRMLQQSRNGRGLTSRGRGNSVRGPECPRTAGRWDICQRNVHWPPSPLLLPPVALPRAPCGFRTAQVSFARHRKR